MHPQQQCQLPWQAQRQRLLLDQGQEQDQAIATLPQQVAMSSLLASYRVRLPWLWAPGSSSDLLPRACDYGRSSFHSNFQSLFGGYATSPDNGVFGKHIAWRDSLTHFISNLPLYHGEAAQQTKCDRASGNFVFQILFIFLSPNQCILHINEVLPHSLHHLASAQSQLLSLSFSQKEPPLSAPMSSRATVTGVEAPSSMWRTPLCLVMRVST